MSALKLRLRCGVILFGWLSVLAAGVQAQPSGIVLVSEPDVPQPIARSLKRRLSKISDVSDAKAASATSEAELSRIAKRAGAALIVRLRLSGDRELRAEFRQGANGAVVAAHEFPIQGRRFKHPARALQALVAASREHLASAAVGEASRDAEPQPEDLAAASAGEPQTEDGARARASEEPSGAGEELMEDPELSERLQTQAQETDGGPRQGLALQASVGLGPGVHALRVPTPAESAAYGEVDTGLSPAVSLSAAAQLGLGQWLLRAETQYRTFFASVPLGHTVHSMDGSVSETIDSPLTSHSFVIGASPGYRFGGRDSVAVSLLLGWTYRSLHASSETLPGVSLRGFVARPALHIPFGDGVFALRLAPELIVVQSSESNALGFMPTGGSGGTGWGAEVAVEVQLAKLLGAGLQYRRSRISAERSVGPPAIDDEWYVAIQAVLSL